MASKGRERKEPAMQSQATVERETGPGGEFDPVLVLALSGFAALAGVLARALLALVLLVLAGLWAAISLWRHVDATGTGAGVRQDAAC